MIIPEIIAALGVNVVTPILGVVVFVLLCRRMRREGIQSPPVIAYFILFACYGAWLVVLLTSLFWKWSGMASIGVLSLVLIAPFVNGGFALVLYRKQNLSAFHKWAFLANVGYIGMILLLVLVWLGFLIFIGKR